MYRMHVRLSHRGARALLAGVLAILLLAFGSLATTATTELKLRERVMELEDERDALQEKYDGIMAQYKTVKGEMRASIDLQKRLDEALAEAARPFAKVASSIALVKAESCVE